MKRRFVGISVGACVVIAIGAIYGGYVYSSSQSDMTSQQRSETEGTTRATYVAFGDSVAAGVGLSTASDSSACDRTNESYPGVIAAKRGYNLVNLACSGATLDAGILGPQTVNRLAVTPQIDASALRTASVVTLTVGANDSQWLDLVTKCYRARCGDQADELVYRERLSSLETKLAATLKQLNEVTKGGPKIIATGYYDVFPASDVTCSDLEGIDSSELAFGRDMQQRLNASIARAVQVAGAGTYVAADFSGHELCSADPWVQGLADAAPYHPTEVGQTKMAETVIGALKDMKR